MSHYATMPSPLGSLLLQSGAATPEGPVLSGLYFVGQKDCPDVPGHPPMHPARFDPSAGEHEGRPIRLLRAGRQATPDDAAAGTALEAGRQAFGEMPLHLMQADTPPDVVLLFERLRTQLGEYFDRRRRVFELPLGPVGTDFQRRVWDALRRIPHGELASYGDVARSAGLSARHGRAVGAAVGRNPLTILIPCHRVVAGSGVLTGYSGGLERKLALLELEGFVIGR